MWQVKIDFVLNVDDWSARIWWVRGDAPGLIAAEQRDRRSTSWLDQPNRLGERHGCIQENPSSLRARASDASGAVGPTEVRLLFSESTHDILSGNHAYQLPLGRHYGETS